MKSESANDLASRDWLLAGLVAIFVLPVFAAFRQDRDWNSTSRLLLSYAIAEHGTVEITDYVAREGKLLKDPPTRDLSSPRPGEFYCDKAPGHSFVGAATIWLASKFSNVEPYPLASPVKKSWPTDRWAILGTNALLTAMTAGLIVLLGRSLGASLAASTLAGLSFAFATNALPYATVYYGHSTAGFFALLSLFGLRRSRQANGIGWKSAAISGLAAGAAVVTEYPVAILPVILTTTLLLELLFASKRGESLGRLLAFLAGGLPMAALLAWYHWRVTGSPWTPPYKFEVEEVFAYHRQGSGIPIGLPDGNVIWNLLFGFKRGILWFAPVALIGLGSALLGLSSLNRRTFAIEAVLLFGGLLAINAGFPTWDGGWSSGPRFLLPALAPLCVCLAWLLTSSKNSGITSIRVVALLLLTVAFGLGLFTAIGCASSGVAIPPNIEYPISDWIWPLRDQRAEHFATESRTVAHFEGWLAVGGYAVFVFLLLTVLATRLDRRRLEFGLDETT